MAYDEPGLAGPRSRVMLIYGTRPEAIKMAPLAIELREHPSLEPVIAVTGQHREMLDQVNELFHIEPEHDLDLMVPGATLADLGARTLAATSNLLAADRPDVVVVQGDTSTAFMAGLAAFYAGLPVVHLEAGLRTGDMSAPFPEEANRRLLAPLASLHLAPTPISRANLMREGIAEGDIVVTGNTVIDALQTAVSRSTSFLDPAVQRLLETNEDILLVTSHRRESWGEPMEQAMTAVRDLAARYPKMGVLLPMHRNVFVRQVVEPILGQLPNVVLTEPLSYHEFTHALRAAKVVLTDSGGVQEEAPSLGKPVLVMRETTERPEAVSAGTVSLVGTDRDVIVDSVVSLLEDDEVYQRYARAVNPYGDGKAAPRCAAAIAQLVGRGDRLPDFRPPSAPVAV